jgi:hypothetical protein
VVTTSRRQGRRRRRIGRPSLVFHGRRHTTVVARTGRTLAAQRSSTWLTVKVGVGVGVVAAAAIGVATKLKVAEDNLHTQALFVGLPSAVG